MNRYETSTPRAALGFAAVAMAAITILTLVVLPAELGSASASTNTLAVDKDSTEAHFAVAIAPADIAVRGMVDREDDVNPDGATSEAQECGRPSRPNSRDLSD